MLQEKFSFRYKRAVLHNSVPSSLMRPRCNAIILHARVVVELILSKTTGVVLANRIGPRSSSCPATPCRLVLSNEFGHITGITSFGGGSLFLFYFFVFSSRWVAIEEQIRPSSALVVLQECGRGVRRRPDTETKKNKRKRWGEEEKSRVTGKATDRVTDRYLYKVYEGKRNSTGNSAYRTVSCVLCATR